MTFRTAVARDLLGIAVLWVLAVALVGPLGDFPLNDDWSFGVTTRHLLETGDFRPGGWTAMTLLTHTLWGALFCLPAGFSFDALRLSTLTAGLLGMIGVYLLVLDLSRSRRMASIAALTLGFGPIYFGLAHTYMTDVTYTVMVTWATLFYLRALSHGSGPGGGSGWSLLLATALTIIATLNRQTAVLLPLAFTAAQLARAGLARRSLVRAALPALTVGVALLIFQYWMSETDRLSPKYHEHGGMLLEALQSIETLRALPLRAFTILLYLGLMLLPILILLLATAWRHLGSPLRRWVSVALGAGVLALLTVLAGIHGRTMPLSTNILVPSGIGPITLHDVCTLGRDGIPALPQAFWMAVTVLAVLGAALLILALVAALILLPRRVAAGDPRGIVAAGIFGWLGALLGLAPFLVVFSFDRYLLPVLPLLIAGIVALAAGSSDPSRTNVMAPVARHDRGATVVAAALVALWLLFSVGGAHDYLAWNRARWAALTDLLATGRAGPDDIDGGFELNGLYRYGRPSDHSPGKSTWWVARDTYLIALGPVPGYREIARYPFTQWLPPREASIRVLLRAASATGSACCDGVTARYLDEPGPAAGPSSMTAPMR